MQKVLRKRILRDLKENSVRYLALGTLIILCMYIIVALIGAADTLITGVENYQKENKLEDGQFQVFVPLTDEQQKELTDMGAALEEQFYLDFKLKDGSTLRVFKDRKQINLVSVEQGQTAKKSSELVLEKRYCEEHNIKIGDEIQIAGYSFTVSGIGCSPDYDSLLKELSDSTVDSMNFGTAFVTADTYNELEKCGKAIKAEEYLYAYRLSAFAEDSDIKDKLGTNLVSFLKAEDNLRIGSSADDQVVNKYCGILAGIIVLALFSYVLSVFVVYGIDRESSTIGALYALGLKRRELVRHYLCLPVIVTIVSSIIGSVVGFSDWGVRTQMQDCYGYFSIPEADTVYPLYLLVYALVLPPLIAILVNKAVISRKLNQAPLSLIRNEQKQSKISNIKLNNMGFVNRFRIRQMIKEMRTSVTVIAGMFISLLILMIGVNCYVMCRHISRDNKADTKYEYMYTYKYPEENVPEGGYGAFAYKMKKETMGYNFDVTMLGITEDNPYFDVNLSDNKRDVVISSAMAEKYGIKCGEKFILSDEEKEMYYAFTVKDITKFSAGFYVFMDIENMRELFSMDENYVNVVFSDKKLDIENEQIYSVMTREDVVKASDVFVDMMMPMVIMMTVVSALVFAVVMYLMMRVMIDRSSFHISMVKVFGYRMSEIKKLYLNGNFYVIAVGAAVCIPLAKFIMDKLYPMLVSNVAVGINLTFSWQLYAGIYICILLLYFIINRILVGKLKRVNLADVLKNRE